MRNLIRFIDKYSFFFLFLLFEVLSFYLLIQNNRFQGSSFLNSTNAITGSIYSKYSSWTDYLNLTVVNQELAEENKRLREKQLNAFNKVFGENVYIKDTLYQRQYHYSKAKIINNSIHKQNNYLTLDKGTNNGVEVGMGVIGPNGVVGVVKHVSKHYASVLSLLHSRAKISTKLKKTNYFGSLQWDGKDYREGILKDIPNHVSLSVGDSVVTSGYSSTFPESLFVGTIIKIDKPEGENFYDLRVKFSNDFKNLSYVYIVKNNLKLEKEKLEKEREVDND